MSETNTLDVTLSAGWATYFAGEEPAKKPDPDYPDEIELGRIYQERETKPDGSIVLRFPHTDLAWDALASLVFYTENGRDGCDDSAEAPGYRAACAEMLPIVEKAQEDLGEIVNGAA